MSKNRTPLFSHKKMFSSFSKTDEYGSDDDNSDDEFATTPIARLFTSGNLRVEKTFKKKKKKKRKKKSRDDDDEDEDEDESDNESVASNESGWSVTSADILDEIANYRKPKKTKSYVRKITTAKESGSQEMSKNESKEDGSKEDGSKDDGSKIRSEEEEEEEEKPKHAPPPLPPAMAKAKALEEAQRNRGRSKWSILRKTVVKPSGKCVKRKEKYKKYYTKL